MEIRGCSCVLPSSGVSDGCACGISDGVAEGPASVGAKRTLALGGGIGGGGISVGVGIAGGGGISGGVGIGCGDISAGAAACSAFPRFPPFRLTDGGVGGLSVGAGARKLTPIFCLTLGGGNAALTLGGERVGLGDALAERGRRVTVVQPPSGSSFTCSTSSTSVVSC